ncbi:hypothetical protein F5Y17DRAFT_463295 [Xylariaceae sp. FL0594]|nr:hypothetical protein F5Y17DRAFT_463295 [Xylariaceae sp. FL0594]
MKVNSIVSALALSATAFAHPSRHPTTVIAGVEVIDTQIVRDAHAVIAKFPDFLYFHCMRTWLYGAAVINTNETLKREVDLEAHALGTILHDLGWDRTPNSPWISHENRFEVDGALGAMKFIKQHKGWQKSWSDARLERVYDGISLHGTVGIHQYKNVDSRWITSSIGYDAINTVPKDVPADKYKSINAQFPSTDFQKGAVDTFTWLAATKPEASYNNFIQDFGTAFVPGFNATGHRQFDRITAGYVH